MKLRMKLCVLAWVALLVGLSGCATYEKVPAGHVGVKVYLLGSEKGVDNEVVGVGRYWVGWNEDLFVYPTFQQTFAWDTEGDDAFKLTTADGLPVGMDLGVTYQIDPAKVSYLFQRYRKGPEEITEVVLYSLIRDAVTRTGAGDSISKLIGPGRDSLVQRAQIIVRDQVDSLGIRDVKLQVLGKLSLPKNVEAAINTKIEATQKALQAENELQRAKAEAAKAIAEAEGTARANELKQKTLTAELVRMAWIEKWDGHLPQVSSEAIPMVTIK